MMGGVEEVVGLIRVDVAEVGILEEREAIH